MTRTTVFSGISLNRGKACCLLLPALLFMILQGLVSSALALPGGLPDPEPGLASDALDKAVFGTVDFSTLLIFHPDMGRYSPEHRAFARALPDSPSEAKRVKEERSQALAQRIAAGARNSQSFEKRRKELDTRRQEARRELEKRLLEARRVYSAEREGKDPLGVKVSIDGSQAKIDEKAVDEKIQEQGSAAKYVAAVNRANADYRQVLDQIDRENLQISLEMTETAARLNEIFYTDPQETQRRLREIAEDCVRAVMAVKKKQKLLGVLNFTPSKLEKYMDSFTRTPQGKADLFMEKYRSRIESLGREATTENLLASFYGKPLGKGDQIHGPVAEASNMLWEWFYGLSDVRQAAAAMAGSELLLFGGMDITSQALTELLQRRGVSPEKVSMITDFLNSLP